MADDKKTETATESAASKTADKTAENKSGSEKKPGGKSPVFAFPVSCKGVGNHIVELDRNDPVAAQTGFMKHFGILSTDHEIKVGEPTEIEE